MNRKVKIGYFADGPWAHHALRRILGDRNLEVAFVVPRFLSTDAVLIDIAKSDHIPILRFENVNDSRSVSSISEYACDLLVSMSYDQIIRKPLYTLPPLGFINCHAGLLPYYRGRNILNWALINGEKKFGISVNYIDDGIDTGDLVYQEKFDILLQDDYGSVLKKAHTACGDVLYKAICVIRDGLAKPTIQKDIHPVGFYCTKRREGDEWLDWNLSAERIHNFVRGVTIPGPCARTIVRDKEVAIIKTDLIAHAPDYIGTPGEVVGRTDRGIVVKTADKTILVSQIADLDENGNANEARTPRFPIGERLGIDLKKEVLRLRALVEELLSWR